MVTAVGFHNIELLRFTIPEVPLHDIAAGLHAPVENIQRFTAVYRANAVNTVVLVRHVKLLMRAAGAGPLL